MQTYEVLLRPVVSEKSTTEHALRNKYTFEVSRRANKIDVRRAVEDRYGTRVDTVRIINVKPKEKGAGFIGINKRRRGLNTQWKKAIVTLAPGERIEDFFGAV